MIIIITIWSETDHEKFVIHKYSFVEYFNDRQIKNVDKDKQEKRDKTNSGILTSTFKAVKTICLLKTHHLKIESWNIRGAVPKKDELVCVREMNSQQWKMSSQFDIIVLQQIFLEERVRFSSDDYIIYMMNRTNRQ